jgi:hypothetical protein
MFKEVHMTIGFGFGVIGCICFCISTTIFWKLLDIYVDEARFNQDLSNIDTFGLDETSVAK